MSISKFASKFDYLLNAFEEASQSPMPGYAEKRRALLEYVAKLEAGTEYVGVPADDLPDAYMVAASGPGGELAVTVWIRLADAEQDAYEWRINGKETEIIPLFQREASRPRDSGGRPA